MLESFQARKVQIKVFYLVKRIHDKFTAVFNVAKRVFRLSSTVVDGSNQCRRIVTNDIKVTEWRDIYCIICVEGRNEGNRTRNLRTLSVSE